jgi:hypothetical protein
LAIGKFNFLFSVFGLEAGPAIDLGTGVIIVDAAVCHDLSRPGADKLLGGEHLAAVLTPEVHTVFLHAVDHVPSTAKH